MKEPAPSSQNKDTADSAGFMASESTRQDPRTPHDASPNTDAYATLATTPPELFGRYRILKQLGRGGMGTVYLAHDTEIDRDVALKTPHFEMMQHPQARERFYREVRAAGRLLHPHICPIYDVGEIGNILYMTMAFIEGKPLSACIDQFKANPDRTAQVMHLLSRAMDHAHCQNIIHRDLKPGNIMLNAQAEPIVMDFGLARMQLDSSLSSSGMIVGTPAYMPPEQANSEYEALGPWSDVYSLGVILYELLTGVLPFRGPTLSVLYQVVHQEPPAPSSVAEVHPALEVICLKAMAKDRSQRYQSTAELAEALERFRRGEDLVPVSPQSSPVLSAASKAVIDDLLNTLRTWDLDEGVRRYQQRLRVATSPAEELAAILLNWIAGDDALEARAVALKNHPDWQEFSGWALATRLYRAIRRFDFAQAEKLLHSTGTYQDCSPMLRASLAFLRGSYHLRMRERDLAVGHFHEALSLYGQGHFLTGRLLRSLGRVYEGKCNLYAAREFFRQAILCQEAMRDEKGLVQSYEEFGRLFLVYGDLDRAEEQLNTGLSLAQRLMDQDGQAQLLNHLGRVALARAERETRGGKPALAQRYLKEAEECLQLCIRHNQEQGRAVEEGRARKDLALLELTRGNLDQAELEIQRSLELIGTVHYVRGLAPARHVLGQIRRAQKRYRESEEALRLAVVSYDESHDPADAAGVYLNLARTLRDQGAMKRNITEAFQKALDRAETAHCSHLVTAIEDEFKAFDDEAHGRRIFRRVRGPFAPDDTSSLEMGWSESISAMFLNLQEFIPYCQGLDPEEVMLTLNQMLADLTAALQTYEGEVTTYLGGGFVALFRHAGHAERAVSAALDLVAVLQEFNRPREVLGMRTLVARLSVASGNAWLGNIGTYQKMSFTAVGMPLNLSARLVRQAQVMTPCISEETFELVRNRFVFREDSPRIVEIPALGSRRVWDVVSRKPDSSSRLPSRRTGPLP